MGNAFKKSRTGRKFGAGMVGAVTISSVALTPHVALADDYPSWSDVQQAKENVEEQEAMINNILALVASLDESLATEKRKSQIYAEQWLQARNDRDEAEMNLGKLRLQIENASEQANLSQMRVGLLLSHTLRSGQANALNMSAVLASDQSSAESDKLLFQLGAVSKLSQQSREIYERAVADQNAKRALEEQAQEAVAELEKLTAQAEQAYANALSAQQDVQEVLDEQQAKFEQLIARLAVLKNISEQAAADFVEGERTRATPPVQPQQPEQSQPNQPEQSQPNQPERNTPPPAPPPSNSVPSANTRIVDIALEFAFAQLGKPYVLGASGPDAFDCSGLTLKAYGAAGVFLGTHSVNNQYFRAAERGQLVAFSNMERGDLIFWGDGPGDFYHIGIYLGDGQMIAAPSEGDVVKIQSVWGSPWHLGARPSI